MRHPLETRIPSLPQEHINVSAQAKIHQLQKFLAIKLGVPDWSAFQAPRAPPAMSMRLHTAWRRALAVHGTARHTHAIVRDACRCRAGCPTSSTRSCGRTGRSRPWSLRRGSSRNASSCTGDTARRPLVASCSGSPTAAAHGVHGVVRPRAHARATRGNRPLIARAQLLFAPAPWRDAGTVCSRRA